MSRTKQSGQGWAKFGAWPREGPSTTFATVTDPGQTELLEKLRAGDDAAFTRVFDEYHATLVRLVLAVVKNPSTAEEVVQDAWVSVIDSLGGFEGRSSLKTWVVRIAVNAAKTRAVRDGRNVSFAESDDGPSEPAVDPKRFFALGFWSYWPDRWSETPEALSMRREIRVSVEAGLAALPAAQRTVVTLRDVEGWSSEEVCNALEISESNQRVLLHRGRSRLRAVLERALKEAKP